MADEPADTCLEHPVEVAGSLLGRESLPPSACVVIVNPDESLACGLQPEQWPAPRRRTTRRESRGGDSYQRRGTGEDTAARCSCAIRATPGFGVSQTMLWAPLVHMQVDEQGLSLGGVLSST